MVIEDLRNSTANRVCVEDLQSGHVYEDESGKIIYVTDEGSVVTLASGTEWSISSQYGDESTFKPLKAKLVIEHE